METFGCCSSYRDCSRDKKCIHLMDPEYAGCAYKANLDAGRAFYAPKPEPMPHTEGIFLYCYNRLFAIYAREKFFSRALTPEQIQEIEQVFTAAHIPYKTEITDMAECIIDGPTEEDPMPANSRVIFEVGGKEYHCFNFNTWFIKHSLAQRIAKAFENNFIPARVDLHGKNLPVAKIEPSYLPAYYRQEPRKIQQECAPARQAPAVEKPKLKPAVYHQVSLYEIMAAAGV